MSHTLASYSMGTDSVTLTYNLTVRNVSAGSISGLTLAYVPLTAAADRITLEPGDLAPQAEIKLPLTVVAAMPIDESTYSRLPLFFSGSCTDAGGAAIVFSAESRQGGAL